jgi:hypothetical protein
MTTTSLQTYTLEDALPSGGWILYFHPAKETRWHQDSFKQIAHVKTWKDLSHLFSAITSNDWMRGKFFFTPEAIPPLMENAKNIRGGSYSLRVERGMAGEMMQKYMVAAVLEKCLKNKGDLVSCIRITPRRDFNILQIWNRDCQRYNTPDGLEVFMNTIPDGEIKYVPHVEKKI